MPLLDKAELSLNYKLVGPEITPDVPPVALIHGLGANQAFWYLGALRHLGQDRAHLIYDMRGHGASSMPDTGYDLATMAADLLLLLDRLGVERAHIVGHSHGARVALVFAQRYPERVESLTMADTQIRALQAPMKLGEWPHWAEWKADLIARGVTTFPPEDSLIDFNLLAELGSRGGPAKGRGAAPASGEQPGLLARIPPAAQVGGGGSRRIDLQSRQMGARGAAQWDSLMERETVKKQLHDESLISVPALNEMTMPVMLMYGELSHCVPTADKLMEILPNGRKILVPGGGHFFPIVKAQYFARVLNGFLARVEAGVAKAQKDGERPHLTVHSAGTQVHYRPARRLTPAFAALSARRRGA